MTLASTLILHRSGHRLVPSGDFDCCFRNSHRDADAEKKRGKDIDVPQVRIGGVQADDDPQNSQRRKDQIDVVNRLDQTPSRSDQPKALARQGHRGQPGAVIPGDDVEERGPQDEEYDEGGDRVAGGFRRGFKRKKPVYPVTATAPASVTRVWTCLCSDILLDDNRDDDLHRNGDQNPFDMSL